MPYFSGEQKEDFMSKSGLSQNRKSTQMFAIAIQSFKKMKFYIYYFLLSLVSVLLFDLYHI